MGVWFTPFPLGYDEPFTVERLGFPITATFACMLGWTTLYFLVGKLLKAEPERASRIVALFHGLLVIVDAYYVIKEGAHDFTDPGTKNTEQETRLLCFTLGYFLYDYGWMVYNKHQEGLVITIHHLLSILTFTIVLLKGASAAETIAAIIMYELTNPFLQTRWLLRDAGYKETTLFTIIDMTFIVMFFLCRLFWGAYFTYVVMAHPRPGLDVKLATLGMLVVSTYMLQMVGSYAYYKYIATPERDIQHRDNQHRD